MTEEVIQVPIYKTAILVYYGDRKGLYKVVKKHADRATAKEVTAQYMPNTDGQTIITKGRTLTICMKDVPRDANSVAALIHELSHATNYILREVGIQHSEETEEVYTYLLEYLTKETLERLLTKPCQFP